MWVSLLPVLPGRAEGWNANRGHQDGGGRIQRAPVGPREVLMDTFNLIRKSVEAAYGSLMSPSWHFAEREYRRSPYAETVERLHAASFDLEETTDLNDDVSCCYYLQKGSRGWALQLSLVGRFAVLLSVDRRNRVSFDRGGESDEIEKILSDAGILLLTEEILSRNLPFGASREGKKVYFVLFSDHDHLPWEVDPI